MTEHALTGTALKVVVAVATYRRPELLRTLLPILAAQAQALPHPTRVVVVDNEPEASARVVVDALALPAVEYVHEPKPGIAAARNGGIAAAAGADLLVFIDDDEIPADGWLENLVGAWQKWQCAAVVGPVVSVFDGPVDPWVRACPNFRRLARQDGAVLGGAATNNLLLHLPELERLGLRFDDRFGLSGGSDTMLTHTLVRHGGVIRWCDGAEVSETVPASRASREWVLRRQTRTGNVWSRVALAMAESRSERVRTRADLSVRGVHRFLRGVLRILLAILTRDIALRTDGECDIATARGVLRGAYGHVVTEYARPAATATD